MPGVTGHGILSRVRSHRKPRRAIPSEELETPKLSHRRQFSDSAATPRPQLPTPTTRADFRGHWPPIEFDPLKLNPPGAAAAEAPHAPPRLHERRPLQSLRPQRSFASAENRRPPRLHHSDSGFSLDGCRHFDFAAEKEKALRVMQRDLDVESKGWPSPASSFDSDKSWFEDDDDDGEEEEEEEEEDDDNNTTNFAVTSPILRPRPTIGSLDDPANFIKRGPWKRRGVVFGVQTEEVYTKDEDAFDV